MAISPDNFRRGLGVAFLTIAVGMVVAGQTILEPHLKEFWFVVYWIACFLFTSLAAMTALIDLIVVRRRSRELQRSLIEETLNRGKKSQPEQSGR